MQFDVIKARFEKTHIRIQFRHCHASTNSSFNVPTGLSPNLLPVPCAVWRCFYIYVLSSWQCTMKPLNARQGLSSCSTYKDRYKIFTAEPRCNTSKSNNREDSTNKIVLLNIDKDIQRLL